MQKKVKSRLTETVFVLLCLACSAFSLSQFWNLLNKSMYKLNEEPIATISFKYKTAQRRFLDDLIWDRLRQESPVYEGDTIRTAALSEATLYFKDGNIMDLQENTMARISLKEDGVEVDFSGGSVTVSAAETSGFKIRSGDSVVEVGNGSVLEAGSTDAGNFNVQLTSGTATMANASGKTASLEEGTIVEFNEDGTPKVYHLAVTYPLQNQKFLNVNDRNYVIPFSWKCDSKTALVETSLSKDFDVIETSQIISEVYGTNISLPSGTHYWRVSSMADNEKDIIETVTGKLTIFYSPSPELISPKPSFNSYYRKKFPQIRFAWTESERATSYELTVADNQEMRNPVIVKRSPQPSCIVNSLGEGTWYWNVAPYYRMNNLGLGVPSKISSFKITQSGELLPAVLSLPGENSLVSTKIPMKNGTTAYQKINFSWKEDSEAANYDFKLWSDNSHGIPAVSGKVTNNYYIVDCSQVNLANGKWYWQVTKNDEEGNSVNSEVRQFHAIDSDMVQRTLFPPDGYHIAQARTQDVRFSWKTNIPYETMFQVARDNSFHDIVFQEKTTATTVNNRSLPVGTYYWRIKTSVEGTEVAAPAKVMIVEPPLGAPDNIFPRPGTRAVIRPNTPLEFKWTTVDGADYYEVKLAKSSDPDKVVYSRSFIEPADKKTVVHEIDMEKMEETNYTWTVQAFREETPLVSRASGYKNEFTFQMKKLKPITLVLPGDKTKIDGATAIKKPGFFSWMTVERTVSSQIVLYKDSVSESSIIETWDNPPTTVRMPPLQEGTYYWTVKGMTADELDISSLENRQIIVTEIPKLPAPALTHPDEKMVFDKDYFKSNRSIKFKWNSVSGADQYVIRITRKNGTELFSQVVSKNTTEYELKDLTKLEKGNLYWGVEAQTLWTDEDTKEKVVFQQGKVNKSLLKIDLPAIKAPKLDETGTLYGK